MFSFDSSGFGVRRQIISAQVFNQITQAIRYINIRQRPSRAIALVWRRDHPRSPILEILAKLLAYKPLT